MDVWVTCGSLRQWRSPLKLRIIKRWRTKSGVLCTDYHTSLTIYICKFNVMYIYGYN